MTSDQDFLDFFNSCEAALTALDDVQPSKQNVGYSIKDTAARVIALATAGVPGCSYHFARMAAVCLVAAHLRLPDYTVREHVLIVWILEGGHRIRSHDGFCYLYHDDGAFQEYRHGVTPEATIGHLKDQLRTVEGVFRRFPRSLERDDDALLKEIAKVLETAGSEEAFTKSCHRECLEAGAAYGIRRRGSEVEAVIPDEGMDQPKKDDNWCRATAGIVLRISQTLMREITRDEFLLYVIHWCDRPWQSRMGVAYSDKAVLYNFTPVATELVTLIDSNPDTGLYVRVPHPLLDPVLSVNLQKLRTYYMRSFWTNVAVFKCLCAAQALAKRGLNVDRLFIGLSPGGVGQSLYTAHLAAIYGKGNHLYYDPNIWCLEEELRKQAENLSCGIILTGQEIPTGARGIKEDLFKRFVTGEPVAARRPYGHETLMLRIVGWKRLEANRHLSFSGVTEHNFNSILRRSFVFRINSRFVEESHLTRANYKQHHMDGIYASDPALHQFVISTPAVGAAIRMQHAFESRHSQADCLRLIDAYCNQGGDRGLTEKTMRKACGLPLHGGDDNTAGGATSVALRQAVEADDLPSQKDPADIPSVLEGVAHRLVKHMLLHRKFSITPSSIEGVKAPGWTDAELWKALTDHKLLFSGHLQGKGDNKQFPSMRPCNAEAIMKKVALTEEDRIARCTQQFKELWAVRDFEEYVKSPLRLANYEIVLATLNEVVDGKPKLGRGKQALADEERLSRLQSARRKLVASEERATRLIQALLSSSANTPSKRRSTSKKPAMVAEASAGEVTLPMTTLYRYTLPMYRTRRHVEGTGAQTLSRMHCRVLLPDTVDLDIENCCFSILMQLIDTMKPTFFPAAEKECLRCADDRAGVCKEMDVPMQEGKLLLNSVLNGQSVSDTQKGSKFLKKLQRTSRCVRWLAAEVVPEVAEHLKEEATRINPYASIVFFWWSAFESLILDEWAQFIATEVNPLHLSLHFDGLRLSTPTQQSVEDLCKACEEHIYTKTEFRVSIREKKHLTCLELLLPSSSQRTDLPTSVPGCLREDGNCILLSMCCLFPDKSETLQTCAASKPPAGDGSGRIYTEVATTVAVSIRVCYWAMEKPWEGLGVGRYLLHASGMGGGHCVGIRVGIDPDDITIYDCGGVYKLDAACILRAITESIDSTTVVLFQVLDDPGSKADEDPYVRLHSLRAAGRAPACSSTDTPAGFLPIVPDSGPSHGDGGAQADGTPADEPDADILPVLDMEDLRRHQDDIGALTRRRITRKRPLSEAEARLDEFAVLPAARLVAVLQKEVSDTRYRVAVLERGGVTFPCPLCPFRSFVRRDRLVEHLQAYHVRSPYIFCPSGTKQFKMVMALWDHDNITNAPLQRNYLARAAATMRRTVVPNLGPKAMSQRVDKLTRLLMRRDGPKMIHVREVLNFGIRRYRRVGNTYITMDFANELVAQAMICKSSIGGTAIKMAEIMTLQGSQLTSLMPSGHPWWTSALAATFVSPASAELWESFMAVWLSTFEFQSLSIDCTFRMMYSLKGQAPHSAPASTHHDQALPPEEARHALLTVKGATGAVVLMKPLKWESAEEIKEAVAELPAECKRQVTHVATDDPGRLLFLELQSVFPNLEFMSLDGLHMAYRMESAFGGRTCDPTQFLREVISKCTNWHSDCADHLGEVYNSADPPGSDLEETELRNDVTEGTMEPAEAEAIVKGLRHIPYLLDRKSFLRHIAALRVYWGDCMGRKLGTSTGTIGELLTRMCSPSRLEWLFNFRRFLATVPTHRRSVVATGTTTNEALHRELNNVFDDVHEMYQSTLDLKLKILLMGKGIAHVRASEGAALRQMRSALVLSRAAHACPFWTRQSWETWCAGFAVEICDPGTEVCQKRIPRQRHPLTVARANQRSAVRQWNLRKPAGRGVGFRRPAGQRDIRRTPFNKKTGIRELKRSIVRKRPATKP